MHFTPLRIIITSNAINVLLMKRCSLDHLFIHISTNATFRLSTTLPLPTFDLSLKPNHNCIKFITHSLPSNYFITLYYTINQTTAVSLITPPATTDWITSIPGVNFEVRIVITVPAACWCTLNLQRRTIASAASWFLKMRKFVFRRRYPGDRRAWWNAEIAMKTANCWDCEDTVLFLTQNLV